MEIFKLNFREQALQYWPKGRRNVGRPKKRWRDQLHFEDQGTGNTPNPSWTRWWWWWWWWWWWTSENFKLVTERKVKPFRFRPITVAKGVGGVALESEGVELQRGLKFEW